VALLLCELIRGLSFRLSPFPGLYLPFLLVQLAGQGIGKHVDWRHVNYFDGSYCVYEIIAGHRIRPDAEAAGPPSIVLCGWRRGHYHAMVSTKYCSLGSRKCEVMVNVMCAWEFLSTPWTVLADRTYGFGGGGCVVCGFLDGMP
jgi:hypothetical protein